MGPGTDLGEFVIESIAGRGGMGVVYRARQKTPGRTVALKVISAEYATDPQFRARFEGEAEIAARIEHPNVIPVYAVGQWNGTLFIAMRFVDGLDLRALLARETRLEPARAAALVDQVGQALDAAHAHGLVHRDVKPANILVTAAGGREHVYLTDFGVSRAVAGTQGVTGTGAFIGTVDYVAPEQARGERVDARADVYSLGCVLFHVLTGTVPFPVDNELAKLYAHGSQPAPSVLERNPDVPPAFEAVVSRAMSKSPDDRYQSAGDLGRAAVAASSGTAVSGAERTVAVGAAAPSNAAVAVGAAAPSVAAGAAAPSNPAVAVGATAPSNAAVAPAGTPPVPPTSAAAAPRRRRLLLAASALAVLVVATAIVVAVAGGGSGSPPTSTLSLTPVQAQDVPAIAHRRRLQEVALKAAAGYEYRLALETVDAPSGSTARTRLPLYMTLMARRGSMPFVTVQRLQLPSTWPWTKSSIVASFTLDPNPDGSGQVGLSWYAVAGDQTDVTKYLSVGPQGIQLD
ncbi:MAG TPA: serine/threonine-protein kinase [Solirubrobacteraceae bacterium]|nr:serine/threonine-protein kinase [Solirubrobacteraceae bacterium]